LRCKVQHTCCVISEWPNSIGSGRRIVNDDIIGNWHWLRKNDEANFEAARLLVARSCVWAVTHPDRANQIAIASQAAVRETALLTPDAAPARLWSTVFMTVAVSGATLIDMPDPNISTAGK
jgi:hypothetical protein